MSTRYGTSDLYLDVDYSPWKAGIKHFKAEATGFAYEHMKALCEQGFETSQEVVPVRTGRLKASGRLVTSPFEVVIVYGGTSEVEYAGFVELYVPYLENSMTDALAKWDSVDVKL